MEKQRESTMILNSDLQQINDKIKERRQFDNDLKFFNVWTPLHVLKLNFKMIWDVYIMFILRIQIRSISDSSYNMNINAQMRNFY